MAGPEVKFSVGGKSKIHQYVEQTAASTCFFSKQPSSIAAVRLPKSLSRAGWSVASMCTENSLLWTTRFVNKWHLTDIRCAQLSAKCAKDSSDY